MELVYMVLGLFVGVVLHSIYFYIWLKTHKVGKLRIDRSDASDKPYLFLEASRSVDEISRKGYVVFRVSNENFISQN